MAGNNIPANVVIRINDREITNSFTGINKEVRKLQRELAGTTRGTEEFTRKLAELQEAERHLASVTEEMRRTQSAIQESSTDLKSFSDLGPYLADKIRNSAIVSNLSLRSIGVGIKTLAVEAWAAIGSIPIIGWIAAGVTAIGFAMKEVLDYNEQLRESNKLTQNITGLQGKDLDKTTIRTQSLEETLGLDKTETLEAARNLVENFGITYKEAIDEIESGAIRGGSANTEFLKSIREYPVFFAKAGFSVKDFVSIINAGFDLGVYDDKLPDALKEFDLSMREQTKSTRDALVNAFGATFSDDILKRVSQGKTTVKDALIEINKESQKYNLSQKQQAQLTADIFRGAGEDVGGFAKIMEAVTISMENQKKPLTDIQQITKNTVDQMLELEEAKLKAMKSDSIVALKREFQSFWTEIQIGYYNFLAGIRIVDREFQASALYMRGFFRSIPESAGIAFSAILKSFGAFINSFEAGGKSISKFFKGDFDGALEEAAKFKNSLKGSFDTLKKGVVNSWKNTNDAGLKEANNFRKQYDAATKAKADFDRKNTEKNKPTNNFDGSQEKEKANAKSAKDAENRRKKEEADREKALEEQRRDLEESLKAEADANNRSLEAEIQFRIDKLKLQADSYEKEKQLADLERSKELNEQRKQQDEILKNIADLETKSANAKTPEAKSNYELALKNQRKLLQTHDKIILLSEDTHQKKLATLREKWDGIAYQKAFDAEQKLIENQRRSDEDQINNIDSLAQAKALLKDNEYLKLTNQELSGIQTLEDAKRALREAADRKMIQAQLVTLEVAKKQLEDHIKSLADGPAKEALLKNLDELTTRITGLKGAMSGGQDQDASKKVQEQQEQKGTVDVLGFSAAQWEESFKNLETTAGKLELAKMAVQALSNAFSAFSQLQQALNAKEMSRFEKNQNRKKDALTKQLNEGWITQEQYNKSLQKLEAETANKKAEMEYKAAKAQKAQQIASAISGTALGVIGALTMQPWTWANIAAAAIVGTMGMVQVGTILAQPLPEKPSFAKGGFFEGFTGDSSLPPDETGERPIGNVKLHQKEWVAPRWMTENPKTANVIGYLESVRTGKTKPMADGGFADSNTTTPVATNSPVIQDNSQLAGVLGELRDVLQKIKSEGIMAYILKNARTGKDLQEMIEDYNTLKNKNKH